MKKAGPAIPLFYLKTISQLRNILFTILIASPPLSWRRGGKILHKIKFKRIAKVTQTIRIVYSDNTISLS